ncbi:MAG: hypothetical protein Q4A36_01520 [Candidatus Saccharibacteria bacterium]|nr:hypothetical protein [Candidatus Saccharibacteria bacterium]
MIRIVFCNIGWADKYDGELTDKPIGDAKYIKDGGTGHEIANFAPTDNFYYGFVETKSVNGKPRAINIENIESTFANSDAIDHVLVVWCATNEKTGGKYIVGWYKDATVFRTRKKAPYDSKRSELYVKGLLETNEYMMSCAKKDGFLLPPENRNFYVPTARKDGYGFGQSDLWYPGKSDEEKVKEYVKKTIDYINSVKPSANLSKNF